MLPTVTEESSAPARARPPFWALHYMREVRARGVCKQLGPEALLLLDVIALEWDRRRYERAPDFFNEQLMEATGIGSWRRLNAIRQRLQDADFILYRPGGKGRAGEYIPTLPGDVAELPDADSTCASAEENPVSDCAATHASDPRHVGNIGHGAGANAVSACAVTYASDPSQVGKVCHSAGANPDSTCATTEENPVSTCAVTYPYTPPLYPPSSSPPSDDGKKKKCDLDFDWKNLAGQLHAFGIVDASTALETAKQSGCDPQHVQAIINHATANRTRWGTADAPGALHKRLSIARPAMAPHEGWPRFRNAANGGPKTPRELDEAREAASQKDREYEQEQYAKKLQSDAARDRREQRFGADLDAMPEPDLDRLAVTAFSFAPVFDRWRAAGRPRTGRHRADLLYAMEKLESTPQPAVAAT